MGSIADNDSGGSYAYSMSKSAVNAAGKSLSIDLKPRGIAVAILHPGYVRTDMTGHNGLIDTDESARGLIARMDELNLDFVHYLEIPAILPNTVEDMLKYAEGKSRLNSKTEREGVVVRSMDNTISFKAISNNFLLNEK